MKRIRFPVLLAACLCVTTQISRADSLLTLQANEAIVQVEPRSPDEKRVNPPSLELSVVASFNCPADAEPESVTFSVADTYKRYGPEEVATTPTLEALVAVPGSQLSPIASADFCIDGESTDEQGLLVPGVATAHVSLRCRGESSSSVHFSSVALPIRLLCVFDEPQEPSATR